MKIVDKIAYVKGAARSAGHFCHWPECRRAVPPAMWGCREHWFRLPRRLRAALWVTFKPGQEVTKTPSKAYLRVAEEIQAYIRRLPS